MVDLTDAGFKAALARGRETMKSEPRAVAARYDRETGRVTVENCTYVLKIDVALDNGVFFGPANAVAMAGSLPSGHEKLLHLGLRRVTRRAVAEAQEPRSGLTRRNPRCPVLHLVADGPVDFSE